MKKIVLLIQLVLFSVALFGQDLDADVFTLKDSMVQYTNGTKTTLIVPQSDGTAKHKNMADPIDPYDGVNFQTLLDYGYVDIERIIEVSPGGEREFTTITAAMNSITDASPSKTYAIAVYPGTYVEQVVGKDYVIVIGTDDALVTIFNNTPPVWTPSATVSSILSCTLACTATSSGYLIDATAGSGISTADNRVQECTLSWSTSTSSVTGGIVDIESDGFILFQSCLFSWVNSNSESLANTSLIRISGDTRAFFNIFAFEASTDQTAGDIIVWDDQSTGITTLANADGAVEYLNASITDTITTWNISASTTSDKIAISTISRMIGGGNGIAYGVRSNTGGTSEVNLTSTALRFEGFDFVWFMSADSPGDVINANFATGVIDDITKGGSGGVGTVDKVVLQNGILLVNTDIVDENMFIPGATNISLKDFFNIISSAGWVSGGDITDNLDGTADVDAGAGLIRIVNDEQATILMFDWADSLNIAFTEGENYVYIDYNSGSPEISVTTSGSTIRENENDKFELYEVIKEGTTLHISLQKQRAKNTISLLQQLLYDEAPIRRTSGLIIDETGTRNITVTSGVVWIKLNRILISAINTSTGDVFDRYYMDGIGGWTKQLAETQWDNTLYDDGSGTLAAIPSNRFSYQDFYIDADGELSCLYGQFQYTSLTAAENAPLSGTAPDRIGEHALFIGRVAFQEGGATGSMLSSFSGLDLEVSPVSNHNDLSGINGSSPYNHLSTGELLKVQDSILLSLQDAYDNSATPQITTSPTNKALVIQEGDISNDSTILEGKNIAGDVTFSVDGKGTLTADSASITNGATVGGLLKVNTGSTLTLDILGQTDGSFVFSNASGSSRFPTLSGKSTQGFGMGLIAASSDANTQPDMNFNVRETDNTDFSDFTKIAFRWQRFGTELMILTRGGNLDVLGTVALESGTLGVEAMDRDGIEALITGGTEDADFNTVASNTYGTTVQTLTETAGAIAWDMSSGSKAKVTIDETSVITITNMPEGAEATIRIVQGDAGDDNVTFVLSGATVEWRGDDTDLTDDSGAIDYISVVNMDGFLGVTLGSNYVTQ